MPSRTQQTNNQDLHPLFVRQLKLCAVQPGETIACLTDSATPPEYLQAAFSAATYLEANIWQLGTNAVPSWTRVGVETIGSCKGTVDALKAADLLICFHVPLFTDWLREVRNSGTRVLMIVDHPDDLAANMSTAAIKEATIYGANKLREAKKLSLKSASGTDFETDITEFDSFYQYGFADEPGHFDHWGAGHLYTFPNEGASNGLVVIDPGDLCVLPYNRYIESEIRLEIVDGFIRDISGPGLDAKLMRDWLTGNMKHAEDMDGFAVSHLGWGTNPYCRADNMALYGYDNDRNNGNGRGIAGNFLFSTGPNTQGGGTRKTTGHYDVPMLSCEVYLDNELIIDKCRFTDEKMAAPAERRDYLHLGATHD